MKKVTQQEQLDRERLEEIRSNAPEWWRDEGGDGRRVPKRDALSWAIAVAGGTVTRWAGELAGKANELAAARGRLKVAEARLEHAAIADLRGRIPGIESEISQLQALLDAAGPWLQHGQDRLQNAVDEAVIKVMDARNVADRYTSVRLPVPPADAAAVVSADRALALAIEARDLNLDRLDADRAELRRLRARVA